MWTIFKVFIEFVMIFFLSHVLGFWPRSMWELSSSTFLKILGCLLHVACRIFVPPPGIEAATLQWEHGVLTTELPRNFQKSQFALYLSKQIPHCDSPSPTLVFCQNINVKKCITVRSIKFEEYNSKKSYQVICT